MNILVVGGGGREHALVWNLRQSPRVWEIFCAPGNAGIAQDDLTRSAHAAPRAQGEPGVRTVDIAADQIEALLAFAKERQIGLTVVGPEQPLALGIVDRFQEAGLRIFGPSRAAAEIETSKVFAKSFMQRHGIPTAKAEVVTLDALAERLPSLTLPVVLKAEGLAAGKGVVIAHHKDDAEAALATFRTLGEAAHRIVIEQYLTGPEASLFVVTDGDAIRLLTSARDHKRIFDGDLGPNTGGMGAISPAPDLSPALEEAAMSQIIRPTIHALRSEGRPYCGVLYAGLMLTAAGPCVLEFNARFGDPEAQAVLMRLSTNWLEIMEATLDHRLDTLQITWRPEAAVCVVLASAGYPASSRQGDVISGLERVDPNDAVVFHAATAARRNTLVTNGGRVLGVAARAPSVAEARGRAYAAIESIAFDGMQFRRDIGEK